MKAAQTCKYWNMLTADNLLWREKCKEAGIDNFIGHMDRRRKKGTSVGSASPYKVGLHPSVVLCILLYECFSISLINIYTIIIDSNCV